jgi:hypothetical protein
MAQLHHLIGAILRDIAQGRVTSDLYSREISRYYEQDSLLRLFPIPRTEIREVEINLRFGISEIAVDPDRIEDRGARLSGIFENHSDILTGVVFDKLGATSKKNAAWQGLVSEFDTAEHRLTLKTEIVNYFEANKSKLVVDKTATNAAGEVEDNLTLMKDEASAGLRDVFERAVYAQLDLAPVQGGAQALTAAKDSVRRALQTRLDALNSDIEFLETSEYKADVIVTADELQKIPEASISSIRIVTSMRNYVWSQVDEKDNTAIRRLIPE